MNARLMRTLMYDKPGTYEFQPAHYPGVQYVRVILVPATDDQGGMVIVELWGHKVKDGVIVIEVDPSRIVDGDTPSTQRGDHMRTAPTEPTGDEDETTESADL